MERVRPASNGSLNPSRPMARVADTLYGGQRIVARSEGGQTKITFSAGAEPYSRRPYDVQASQQQIKKGPRVHVSRVFSQIYGEFTPP